MYKRTALAAHVSSNDMTPAYGQRLMMTDECWMHWENRPHASSLERISVYTDWSIWHYRSAFCCLLCYSVLFSFSNVVYFTVVCSYTHTMLPFRGLSIWLSRSCIVFKRQKIPTRWQIAAEWLETAQYQWKACRKPPSLFRRVQFADPLRFPLPKIGVPNAPARTNYTTRAATWR